MKQNVKKKNSFTEEEKAELKEALNEVKTALDERLKSIAEKTVSDIMKAKESNGVALSSEAAPKFIHSILKKFTPEEQNLIIGEIVMKLTAERKDELNRAKVNLIRSEESLSQFLTVANGSKYAEVKA